MAGRRNRKQQRVRFDGPAAVRHWQCEPDAGKTREKKSEEECRELQHESFRLQCADGDIFEVQAKLLQNSEIIAQLDSDYLEEEEVPELPLPGVSARGLRAAIDHLQYKDLDLAPNDLHGDDRPRILHEILRAFKLLGLPTAGLVELVNTGRFGDAPLEHLALDSVLLLLAGGGASTWSEERLREALAVVANRPFTRYCGHLKEAVTPMLNHENLEIQEACKDLLFDNATVDALCILMQHRDIAVRARALRMLPRRSEEDVPQLLALLEDCALMVREIAAKALETVAPPGDRQAVQGLVRALSDNAREVREAAVSALLRIAVRDDAETIASVREHLAETADFRIQDAALRVLSSIDPDHHAETAKAMALQWQERHSTMAKIASARILKNLATSRAGDDHGACDDDVASDGSTSQPDSSWAEVDLRLSDTSRSPISDGGYRPRWAEVLED
eukprot:TRINITY_DN122665_c0_g1_i1.p1 TRINITY_DN122665_c0_g1~~TRINITY_DN122665_c0_g1_i1.p1  ORF type:complete len:449 (-),score=57.92 TRINITY_DN122665_c0_g1_i1:297-1643(-)